ncbi:MAG: hydrogenase expression/formation protein HypE, partial [Calditrichia bacterium]
MNKTISAADFAQCPLPVHPGDTIQLGHGSGGKMMNDLISKLFLWAFDNSILNQLDDFAILEVNGLK